MHGLIGLKVCLPTDAETHVWGKIGPVYLHTEVHETGHLFKLQFNFVNIGSAYIFLI